MAAHGRRRSVMLWAFVAVAVAHGLAVLWLAAQASILKFRAEAAADRGAIVVLLQPLPGAVARPRLPITPPPFFIPAPQPALPGPASIDAGKGSGAVANLAKPVFLDWPHPVPTGVDWGPGAETGKASKLALSGGWSSCRHASDKDQDAWSPDGQVKPPCLRR